MTVRGGGRVEALRAAEPDLLGLAVDGHLGPAGGDAVAHLPLGQHDRLVDRLLDRRRQVLVDLKRDRHRHVGVAAEGDDRLALGQRPGGAELALALLAPAEDAVVERLVGTGQDLDLAEAAVGLGVERGGDHVVDRRQRTRRGSSRTRPRAESRWGPSASWPVPCG